jgi:Zn-dependent peptidase ImmA (M78 family)
MVVDVAVVADALRSHAGQVVPPFNAYGIIEARWPTAVITGRELPIGIDEVVSITEDGALIIYGRSLSTAERRFAIAHAMAHLMFDLAGNPRRGVIIEPEREARADRFAQELLVPDRVLMRHLAMWPSDCLDREMYLDQVDHIAATFHVPPDVIDKRIRELETVAKS